MTRAEPAPDRKLQTGRDLRREMIAVARGEHPAPVDAGQESFESTAVLAQPPHTVRNALRKPTGRS